MEIRTRSKAVSIIVIFALALFAIVGIASSPNAPLGNTNVSSEADAASFLLELGWETNTERITAKQTSLPAEFDETFIEYNTLQIQQGCDLSPYAGKSVVIYTAEIINYSSTDTVYATIIVYRGNVIGGDIHSASMDGFMHTLK